VGRAHHRRFLVSPEALEDAEVTLSPAQARQLSAVLRLRAGDAVTVFDGAGREWTAQLTLVTPRQATARLLGEAPREAQPGLRVTLAQVVPRGAAMDLIVAKATELGVSRIVPLEAERSVRRGAALEHRWDRGNFGWRQDDIFMAYLGLARDAKASVVGRARKKDGACRFPAFWGPNYDWTPDQDHGGVLMKTLQAMLLQTDGSRIFLLPAWPKDWGVSFKLHAPGQTTVECVYRGGKVEMLKVTPDSRRKDVEVMTSAATTVSAKTGQ
jgi:hypothetical protein